jgi:membrane protein
VTTTPAGPARPRLASWLSATLNSVAHWAERRFPRAGRSLVAPLLMAIPRVRQDRLGVEAGSITYGALLSIPPLLLLAGAVAGFLFANDPEAQRSFVDSVEGLVPGLEGLATDQLRVSKGGQVGTGLVAIAGLVWAASGFAARARTALSAIFRGPPTGLIFGRLSAALVGVPVFLAIVALTVVTGLVEALDLTGVAQEVVRVGFSLAVFIASIGFFMAVYWALTPRGLVPFSRHLPGATVFAFAWVVLGRVGGYFVGYVSSRSTALYGVIGGLFGVLAFIYIAMWCFLLAAEITQTFVERRDCDDSG